MRAEVSELLKDPEFMEKIMDEKDKEKVKELFSGRKVDLSDEELNNIGKEIYDSLVLASELSEKETEIVSGGVWDKLHAGANWLRKKVGLATPEEKQALQDQIKENKQILQESEMPDTWVDIADRNKGKLAVGAVALTLCAVYGVKSIKKYLNKSRKKKNWINNQKLGE